MSRNGKVEVPDRDILPGIMMIFILALIIVVVCNALFFSDSPQIVIQSSTGTADFDAVTAAAQAERVSRTAEWTIASVLTLGSALIGLNFYTSHRNYHDERERIEKAEKDLQRQTEEMGANLDKRLTASLEMLGQHIETLRTQMDDSQKAALDRHTDLTDAFADTVPAEFYSPSNITGIGDIGTWNHDLLSLASALAVPLSVLGRLTETELVIQRKNEIVATALTRWKQKWRNETGELSDFERSYLRWANTVVENAITGPVRDEWSAFISQLRLLSGDEPKGATKL